jgi:spore maturation protein CgeB
VNGCGAFQLSYYVEGLERLYDIGNEIAIYLDPDDLLQKVKLYLANEALRSSIAEAGYVRTQSEHTFDSRFHHVFDRMGLRNA